MPIVTANPAGIVFLRTHVSLRILQAGWINLSDMSETHDDQKPDQNDPATTELTRKRVVGDTTTGSPTTRWAAGSRWVPAVVVRSSAGC